VNARELFNDGSKWTDIAAREAFPVVLRYAINGDPITYGALNEALKARGKKGVLPITYRYAAGKIGDICEALSEDMGKTIPLLNTIITSGDSGLPSHGVNGYLARSLHKTKREIDALSSELRDVYAREAMDNVFNYVGWDKVGRYLGLASSTRSLKSVDRGKPIKPPDRNGFATGPETEAHKALKVWVAKNPGLFTAYGRFNNGTNERMLSSGDRLDVLFENDTQMLAVEVKAKDAPAAEVERGVYQCVKYRATVRAMQIAASRPPNGNAVLVVERDPIARTLLLAERLSVKILTVGVDR
jgi:hypothetical protein